MGITVEVGQADFMMVPRGAGFIKQTGDGVEGPPVIVYNHRRVLPGKMEALLKAQQEFADLMYKTVPGVVAITSGVDDNDPNLLHDLQVFADFDGSWGTLTLRTRWWRTSFGSGSISR